MEKGPSRRCDSSYKHPLGQPLNLKLVNDKTERVAQLVDPYNGHVFFDYSLRGHFDWYNKSGKKQGLRGGVGTQGGGSGAADVGKLMENKSRSLSRYYGGHTKKRKHTVAMNITV